jgi:Fe-S-cluster containining protein
MFNTQNTDLSETEADQLQERPDLCHKCGRCCRSATTYNSYKKLQELAEAGTKEAIDFLEIFEPFPSIEAARKVVPEQVEQVLRVIADRDDMNLDEVTFYHCRYVTEEGLCGIYERRPRCCQDAPYHGWAVMPPGCGFEGWQFVQREMHKASVRKLKESQFLMKMLSEDGIHTPSGSRTLEQLDSAVQESIQPWAQFGSEYW